jgi:hypothetical protein
LSFYRGWLEGFYVSFDLFGFFQVEEMQGLWLIIMPLYLFGTQAIFIFSVFFFP